MTDLHLGNCAKLWQSSFLMVRLMNTFIAEINTRILSKQTNLLQNLASGVIKTVTSMQQITADILADLDAMKQLSVVCETVEDVHLDHLNSNRKHTNPSIKYRFISDCMQTFDLTVFGYIRQESENKLKLYIPDGVKQLCFMFHGTFIMDSCILNSNNVNCVGSILKSTLNRNALKLNKMYDSLTDGFDSNIFDMKFKDLTHCIGVIRTNYNHIFVSYFMDHWLDVGGFVDKERIISFLFNKHYESSCRINSSNCYVFPNEFDCSELNSTNIDQIFASSDQGTTDFPGNEKIKEFSTLPNCINIEQFEMFQLATI